MKPNVKFMLHIGASIVVGWAIALLVVAQDRGDEPPIMKKDRDFETASRELRRISEPQPKAATRPQPAELLAQVRSDFRTIQMVNKNLKQALSATTPLDLKFVSDSALEIRQRAEDLNTILPLPKRDKAAQRMKPVASLSPDDVKVSVSSLSKLIQEFIANPCFKEPISPDNEQSRKARLDLENIIELSKQLQKDSQKLEKAFQK
jgi:hypothetical protein